MNSRFKSLIDILRKKFLTISVAESCTGGKFCSFITEVPDCSSVFMGGIVAYNNEIKRRLLGVHSDTLKIHGAVSKETAMEMINGLKFHFDTHLSISITGIAGPNGGTITKPVGTIFVCYKYIDHIEAEKLFFSGTREEIQEQVCNHSVEKLIEMLKGVEK